MITEDVAEAIQKCYDKWEAGIIASPTDLELVMVGIEVMGIDKIPDGLVDKFEEANINSASVAELAKIVVSAFTCDLCGRDEGDDERNPYCPGCGDPDSLVDRMKEHGY